MSTRSSNSQGKENVYSDSMTKHTQSNLDQKIFKNSQINSNDEDNNTEKFQSNLAPVNPHAAEIPVVAYSPVTAVSRQRTKSNMSNNNQRASSSHSAVAMVSGMRLQSSSQMSMEQVQAALSQRLAGRAATLEQGMHNSNFLFIDHDYDPYSHPPDLEMARQHGLARRVSRRLTAPSYFQKICRCCGFPVQNEQIPLKCDLDELAHLGTCFPLYFIFAKQALILLGQTCKTFNNSSFICHFSFLNIRDDDSGKLQKIQSLINFFSMILLLFVLELFKIYQKQKRFQYEKNRIGPSDFSVMVSQIPPETTVLDIINRLDFYVNGCKQEIVKIFLLYDLGGYARVLKEKKHILQRIIYYKRELRKLKKQQIDEKVSEGIIHSETRLADYEKRLYNIVQEQRDIEDMLREQGQYKQSQQQISFAQEANTQQQPVQPLRQAASSRESSTCRGRQLKFSGNMIIVFDCHDKRNEVLKAFTPSRREIFYNSISCLLNESRRSEILAKYVVAGGSTIKVIEAPEPSDLLWQNVSSTKNKRKLVLYSYLASYGLMIVCLVLIVTLKHQINKSKKQINSQFWQLALGFVSATIVAAANTGIGIVIRTFARREQINTQTDYFISTGKRLTRMFAMNMLLTTFFSNLISYNFVSNDQKSGDVIFKVPLDLNAAINEYFMMFITSSYLSCLFSIFDIVWGYRLLQRQLLQRQAENTLYMQQDANDIFEGHPIDLALRYANVIKNVQYSMAICPLVPMGVPMAAMGVILIYFCDKYLLLRRWVCSNFISYRMAKSMLDQMHLSILYFASGNLVAMFLPIKSVTNWNFPPILKDSYFYLAFLGFIIAFVLHMFPVSSASISSIYYYFTRGNYIKSELTARYNDLQEQELFFENYDLYHPIYTQTILSQKQKSQQQQQQQKSYQNVFDCRRVQITRTHSLKSSVIYEEKLSNEIIEDKCEDDTTPQQTQIKAITEMLARARTPANTCLQLDLTQNQQIEAPLLSENIQELQPFDLVSRMHSARSEAEENYNLAFNAIQRQLYFT